MVGFIFVSIFLIVVLIIIFKGKGRSENHPSDAFTPNAAMNDNASAMDSIVMQENGTHSSSCDDFTGNDVSDSSSFDSGSSDSAGGCD